MENNFEKGQQVWVSNFEEWHTDHEDTTVGFKRYEPEQRTIDLVGMQKIHFEGKNQYPKYPYEVFADYDECVKQCVRYNKMEIKALTKAIEELKHTNKLLLSSSL